MIAQSPHCQFESPPLYAQRNIPVIREFYRDIRKYAAPGAVFMNYANPMAMNIWAAHLEGTSPNTCLGTASAVKKLPPGVTPAVGFTAKPAGTCGIAVKTAMSLKQPSRT